jgi:hypothetical protein
MTRIVGNLIIAISLVLGAVAATTAYVPRLTDTDTDLQIGPGFAHLNAPAGAVQNAFGEFELDDAGNRIPLVETGTELTPQVQFQLRQNGVTRVRIKEFTFQRWELSWLFVLAAAGLILGARIVTRAAAREIIEHGSTRQSGQVNNPQQAVQTILDIARSLHEDLPKLSTESEKANVILTRIDRVQKHLSMQIVDSRNILISQLGLTGFAEFMDAYSRMERALNRAWSAAADGVLDEAFDCISAAVRHGENVQKAFD